MTTSVVVDREGKVREIGTIIIANPSLKDAARERVAAMNFTPFLADGNPVQVFSRITMPYKTARPADIEDYGNARSYFESGRRASFLAAAGGAPYVLRAEFVMAPAPGKVEKGQYEDTWVSNEQWRREARIGDSHYVRAQNGAERYEMAEGANALLLKLIFRFMEPVPAVDPFYEGDWHIQRDGVDGADAIRILSGYVTPDGKFDDKVRAFWFDDQGTLLKAHVNGVDVIRGAFEACSGTKTAREISVVKDGKLAVKISVTDIAAPAATSSEMFTLKGHEWKRAFTDEVR
jgi:hypothetical protein